MTENKDSGITMLLEAQYSGAKITILDEDLPPVERIFFREPLEDLIRSVAELKEGEQLILTHVRLDRNFKPITFEWELKQALEHTDNDQLKVIYNYLIEGDHGNDVGSTLATLLMRSEVNEEGVYQFSEEVAEYVNHLKGWDRKIGTLVGSVDESRIAILELFNRSMEEDGDLDLEVLDAITEHLTRQGFETYGSSSYLLTYDPKEVNELEVVYEDNVLAVTKGEDDPDTGEVSYGLWLKV